MIITQFNTDATLKSISGRHHAWHTPGGAHGFPGRAASQGSPGSGTEFLTFHRNMMGEFFTWNNVNHAASGTQISAWTGIPTILKSDRAWSPALQAAETRILSNTPAFTDQDSLGIHIETTIHNWIHGAVGRSSLPKDPGEDAIISGLHSVGSTYFYQIHGLVQFWWDQWLQNGRGIFNKRIIDSINIKARIKENLKDRLKDNKENAKELIGDGKHFTKEVKESKEKDKDLVESPKGFAETPFPERPDINPEIEINTLKDRIRSLENTVRGFSFIRNEERPDVGGGGGQ